jgi:hypothetical protein
MSSMGRAMAQAVSRRPLTAGPGFDPRPVHVGFVVDKVALGQVFPRVLRFSPSISFHECFITRKTKNESSLSQGLHNKPQGCGASVASAAGSFTTKKKSSMIKLTALIVQSPIISSQYYVSIYRRSFKLQSSSFTRTK